MKEELGHEGEDDGFNFAMTKLWKGAKVAAVTL